MKLFLIAASAILTIAGPVVAREPGKTSDSSSATTAPAAQPGATRAAKPQLYCIEDTVTGSRIPYRTCDTRAGWMKQGFDPLNPDK